MMKKLFSLLLIAGVLISFAGRVIAAQPKTDVYIGITSVGDKRLPAIGMPPFRFTDEKAQPAAVLVHDVMRADLLFARYFDVTEDGPSFNSQHLSQQLNQWGAVHASYLLAGDITYAAPYFTIKIYVYDISTRTAVFAKAFKGTESSLRRLAHIASDQIVAALMGKRGIADTKIAFANNSTRHKEIYVVDYDGENLQKLTNDKSIAILPRWSKDGKIFYTTYKYKNPDIFAIDLRAGKIAPVIIRGGLSLIGGVSPDGKALAFTSSGGKYITFVSNRAGNPQIYVMELATGETRPLTKTFNWSDSPQWSPTGEWIVFTGRESPYHPMDIFLVDLTGTQIRRLTTDAGSNEDPTWSPDGRFIAFTTTRNGKRQLYMMDMDGSAPHLLADLKGDSFTPHWSF